jgi:phosphatidylglycerol---prolipoprotein diacylglyceryl transferase
MLAYYMHNLTPKIFEIYGIGPRWYGFSYLLGFICAYFLVMKLSRQGLLKVPTEKVPDMVLMFCIFGVLIGGRLGYVLFYDPHLLIDFSDSLPYWGVLRVNQGGMSAHGGVVGTVIAILIYAWRNKVNPINVGDASCMVVPVGLFFGRIANFINGELYGHITKVSWAVQFPTEMRMPPPTPGELTVKAEDIDHVINQVMTQYPDVAKKIMQFPEEQRRPEAIDQIISMVQHGNQQVADFLRPILPVRHPSQLYEALLEGLLLFIICWTIGQLWRKRGMASGAFLTFYPVMRIIGEQFRVGDAPVGIFGMSVAKGVLYSVPMFFFGLGFWIYFIRKPGEPALVNRK